MSLFPGTQGLNAAEIDSLLLIAPGFMGGNAIPKAHRTRLIELGLIRMAMGGMVATPTGRMAARCQVGR